jgi:hypothetical protein
MDCLGSGGAERSYQPHLIALPIVPDYLRERAVVCAPEDSLFYLPERLNAVPFWDRNLAVAPLIFSKSNGQLNTLQTVVLISHCV